MNDKPDWNNWREADSDLTRKLKEVGALLGGNPLLEGRPMYFDRDGKPMSRAEWIGMFEYPSYKRVAEDTVGPYWISTVWLGMDHSFGGGPPLIFETMVFNNDEANDPDQLGLHDLDCRRYTTEEEALQGHEEMVTLVRATWTGEIE